MTTYLSDPYPDEYCTSCQGSGAGNGAVDNCPQCGGTGLTREGRSRLTPRWGRYRDGRR